ncbi:MAG TPA: PPC domain-containing protein, partial [Pirellulales bacterium]
MSDRAVLQSSRVWVAIAVLALATLATPSAHAASPSLGSVSPNGAQRGTEIDVTFNGARLADAQEILFLYPGISVKSLEAADGAVKTKLAIAPDCRLGQHSMRIRTASGISELRTFYVGALPEAKEVEPNSQFTEPQKIALDTTINGVIENEDVDYFLVEAKKGERITAEVEGIRLGYAFFDPYVAIMDMQRFELASSDDAALVWQDAVASVVAPADGTYVIQLRETAYGGSGACMYRLHVGRFPRPRAIVPAGGKFGETVDVRWLGDVLGERTDKVTLPAGPMPKFGLFAQDDKGISPSPNVFRLGELGNTLEVEPNADAATATPCEAPIALGGVIGQPGDVDCFKFAAKKGQAYDIRVLGRGIRSPLDPVLNINRIAGQGVAGNDDSGGPDSYVRFTAPEDDQYVIIVQDHLRRGGPEFAYRVEITPIRPRLVMGLPERQQYVDVTVSVPQANRTAFLVSASRADFGGDLSIDLKDLPPGVAVETDKMPANQTQIPVLLTAAPEATLAGRLTDIVGKHVDPAQNIEGHLEQTTSMVRGQNNINVWTHAGERLATAVTEASPFSIEIVQPKVPIVRDGSMDLKIHATRKEGFKAPISVYMLYNPPGVGSPSSVTIPEGQNDVVMPLTANSGAEVRVWKIAAMASATVGNGSVLVSSQL